MASTPLPYHVAVKKIPYINSEGKTVTPEKENGMKLEMFVFDSFPHGRNVQAYEVVREGEFSAVKNAPGAGVLDSPETARNDLSLYHQALARKAGAKLVEASSTATSLFEISPLVSYQGEDLEEVVKGKTFTLPYHLASL